MGESSAVIARTAYTRPKIEQLREALKSSVDVQDCAVVIGGSYARCEASPESDLDFYLVCDTNDAKMKLKQNLNRIRETLKSIVPKPPAKGGAFEEIETIDEMVSNIGGEKDSNQKITRRVLFLLEGEWLFGQSNFVKYRERLVRRYIQDTISEHHLSRFLLNDLIRYYRTVCVDFEHKTREEGKAWGLRNIKLQFSRKLLYFSGILVAAESAQLTPSQKVKRTLDLLALTPLDRIRAVCGPEAEAAISMYGNFLEAISDPTTRKMLEDVPVLKKKHPEEFRSLKNDGYRFTWELVKLLNSTYVPAHPIHNALTM